MNRKILLHYLNGWLLRIGWICMWIKRKQFDQLKEHVEELNKALREAQNRAVLLDITTEGKKLKLIFVRKGGVYEIETMRLMSDNLKKWKDDLLR